MAIPLVGFTLVALLLQTQGQEFHVKSESVSPTLTYQFLGPKWQKLSFIKGNVSLYSSQGDDIFVTCQAPYPIQWNMSGIIRPADVVHIVPPKRDLISRTYEITLNIFFLDAEKSPELLAASVVIACEQINNYQVRDEMSVFVRGNNPLVEPLNKFVTDSFHIPCPTTDPTITPQLVKLNPNGRGVLVQNVKYRPTEGFYSNIIFNGIFECRKGAYSVRIIANETRSRAESHFAPVEDYIRRFSDEVIELECSSTTRTVHLVFNHNGTEAEFVDNTPREKVAHLRRGASSRPNETVITGKAACVAEGPELLKEWTFEFIEAPSLHIDNFEGELDCLSRLSPKLVQSVRCKNSMDCKFMSHCLQNTTFCNFKKQKQFYADTDTRCFIDSLRKGKDCVSVPFSHLNGLAQCNVRGLTRQWEFFISLDYARYSNWKDAPTNELVRIEEVSRTSSPGVRRFLCTSLAYLFADSLTFEVEYKNRTQKLIRGIDVSNYTAQRYPKIYEFSYRVVLDIGMSQDIVGINCIAPFWNSSDIVKASKCFGHSVKAPHPLAVEYIDRNTDILMKRFNIGETNKKLICHANSTSSNPVYQWHYKVGENSYLPVSEKFTELTFTKGEIGQGILEFPEVVKQYGGEYRCSVTEGSNPGNVTSVRKYTIHVSAEPMSGNSIVFAGVVILALVVFGLIMAALAVYVSRKKTDNYKNNYNNYSNSK